MPEISADNLSDVLEEQRSRILRNIDNLQKLSSILKSLKENDTMSMDAKIDQILLIFTTESKTPKYDLISYLWNFLKILYNNMVSTIGYEC